MRWRRGLIVAIWVSCLERGGAKTNILSDRTPQFSRLASTPAQRVRSIGVDDAAWDHSVFSNNRDRLLEGDIAAKFLAAVLAQPKVKKLLSSDHFSVDGTLIEAWASMKSVKPKDGSGEPPAGGGRNAEADFHGQKRSNDTHASTTDPDARLYRKGKGKETKLCFIGHGLMENRHGLLVDACLTQADGHAGRWPRCT